MMIHRVTATAVCCTFLDWKCPWLIQHYIHRWLAVNLEFIGNGVVLAAAILSVMGKNTLSPGIVGLAVSHSLQVRGTIPRETLTGEFPVNDKGKLI